jgi:hypothetical protein
MADSQCIVIEKTNPPGPYQMYNTIKIRGDKQYFQYSKHNHRQQLQGHDF